MATEWSANGKRMIGQFLSHEFARGDAVSVNPVSGRIGRLDRKRSWTNTYTQAFGIAGDGSAVLAQNLRGIAVYRYGGAGAKLIVRGGDLPDWNR